MYNIRALLSTQLTDFLVATNLYLVADCSRYTECVKKSRSTLKRYSVSHFFWSRNILKRDSDETKFLREYENYKLVYYALTIRINADKLTFVTYRVQAPAVTASCDRLTKCWTRRTESCFIANHIIQHVLLKPERPAKFSQSLVDRLVKRKKRL